MDYRRMYDSEFVASWDLEDDVTVTIDKVVAGEVGGEGGRDKERKPILYFSDAKKPMVLNKTNAKAIVGITGSKDTDDWVGAKITLYVTTCEAFGDTVECIRVRPVKPAKAKAS